MWGSWAARFTADLAVKSDAFVKTSPDPEVREEDNPQG